MVLPIPRFSAYPSPASLKSSRGIHFVKVFGKLNGLDRYNAYVHSTIQLSARLVNWIGGVIGGDAEKTTARTMSVVFSVCMRQTRDEKPSSCFPRRRTDAPIARALQ